MFARLPVRQGLALAAALTATAVLYAALPGATLGSVDDRANTTTLLAQNAATVARDADGDYVVAWVGATATDSGDVFFQRYDSAGVAQGDETLVNTTTAGTQNAPAVAMDATGNFVIAWAGNGAQAEQADDAGIFIQRFDSAGAPLGGEIRVNTTTDNTQDLPAAAVDTDGDLVVVWQSLSQDGSGQGVYAQRFDAAGIAQGGEFQVNTYTTGSQRDASVAMDLAGNFVVVWESNGQDGDLNGIYGKLYAADGTEAPAGEFAINTVTAGSQDNPVVSLRADGEFVVAWSGPDADGTGVHARRFDAAGSPIDSGEFAVNASTTGAQQAPAIARAAEGSFVIAWESNHGGTYDIFARRYDAAGVAGTEGEIAVNATTAGDQRAPAVAVDADGDAVVAWQGGSTDVDVFSRRVVGPEAVDLAITQTDDADPVSAGGFLTYTLTVANLHPAVTPTGDAVIDAAIGSAAGVTVTDTLPAGDGDNVTFLDAEGEGWTCDNDANTSVTCTLDGVLPPDTVAAPISVTVAAPAVAPGDRTIVNAATVTSSQYDDVPGNDSALEDTAVCGPGESAGTLNVSSTSAVEGADGPLTVTRSGGTCGAVAVQVGIADGTATAPADYAAMGAQTLNWANGQSGARSAPNPIEVVDDAVFEADETVAVVLGGATRAAAGTNGTFTIFDNEPAPTLSIADASVVEGNSGTTPLPFTVTLTPAPGTTVGRTVTVEYDTANGTATTGDNDYAAVVNGLVTFTPGQTEKSATVTVNGDIKDEADETFSVTLSNADEATLGVATATGTIVNDDAPPAVSFALASSSVSESGTGALGDQPRTHAVQVSLSTASSRTVTVDLAYAGTAASPADYTANATTLTFNPGQTSQNVTLTVAIDALDEDDETVAMTLNAPENATLGAQATHTATILDDDATPTLTLAVADDEIDEDADPATATFTVSLSAVSGRDVTVNYSLGGTAALGTDYTLSPAPGPLTIPAGSPSTAVTVTVVDDALDENNETVVATLGSPQNATLGSPSSDTLTILDDDATPTVAFTSAAQGVAENVDGGTATATVVLSAVSGRTVTVPFTVNAGAAQPNDATSGTDFTLATTSPVTIPAGSTSATITVDIVNDSVNEPDENVRLGLGTPTNATAAAPATHVITIANDDTLPQASFASPAQARAEGAGPGTVTVQLSRAADEDVTLSYTLSGTALAGSDYTVSPASPFIIAEGESSAVLTITPVDDDRVETDETAILTLGNAVNATILEAAGSHTFTITDDDAAGVNVVESGGSTDVVEGGATDAYTLALASEPAADVVIELTTNGQVTVMPAMVTFTPADWDVPQAITVEGVDDAAGEGMHADTVTHAVSSADLDYDGHPVANVEVQVTDNDVPAIVIEQSGGGTTVTEGGATDSYFVTLSAMPAQDVTVTLTPDDQLTPSTTSLTFTPADWDQPQPVTVTAVDDFVAEGTHLAAIAHASASVDANFDSLTANLTAQVTDNDIAGVVLSKTSATAAEGGAGDSYTVRLGSQPINDVVVMVAPDAQLATGLSEIVFSAVNWNLEVAVDVSAVDDALNESSPHAGVVQHGVSATASDAAYDGIAVDDVAVAITDNDPVPGVTLSLAGSPLAESGGVATVTATLSAVSGQDVTVNLAYGGSATPGADYGASAGSITIPAGALEGSVTITALDDALDEPDETVTVDIDSVVNGAETGTQQVIATIVDDDAGPAVTLSLAGSPLAEAGGVATVTATLSAPSGQAVTVNLGFGSTATPGTDYMASANSIVVAAGSTSGTVTLTGVDDALDEAGETVVVDIDSVANGAESGVQQVVATIVDDDAGPAVTLSSSASDLPESGGSVTVTATLSAVSGQAVTVSLGFGGTATSGTDYAASAGSITIAAGSNSGSITLASVDDNRNEPNETIVVDITAVTNGTESGTQQVTVTLTDDDRGGGGGSFGLLGLGLLLPALARRRRHG